MKKYFALFLDEEFVKKFIVSIIFFIVLYVCYRLCKRLFSKKLKTKAKPATLKIVDKIVKNLFLVLSLLYFFDLFGINISGILGAAGIAGVAIGFAAQTSMSNIISGFFVLSEKAFKIGDYISVNDVSGTVKEINLLSVKVLTPDNQMVRIPNQSIINSNLINNTYYDIRRLTIQLTVEYASDLEKVQKVLESSTENCSYVLKEPAPLVYFDGFGEYGIIMVLAVWFEKQNLIQTKNQVYKSIKEKFDKEGIRFSYKKIDVSLVKENNESF